ncbi:PP0621 family protein [Helicobacter cappadocius]|uniref:PP0621 family protein n=1 Tax=Helicobacter cappadocius TaxID=3063998 RepID=A0AA90PLY1_9HELI|nr:MULTISPECIES: PP0621 family protein [unclassified Helicobacter]MDO7253661.1 PP0621 family protein [Helicobacter sp. faydin-H75]MDP2539589.1 PP0621 family protein [Helicobacter sp. faydin-H76]
MRLVIILVIIALIVWFFFYRKPSVQKKQTKKPAEEIMLECCKCGTYISSQEAIISHKKCFCSKKCLDTEE